MIRSMTGFGRATATVDQTSFLVEVRTLNHRHADIQIRTPRGLSELEVELRQLAKDHFGRGKIDVTVSYAQDHGSTEEVQINSETASEYAAAARKLAEEHGLTGALSVDTLLSLPGVARLEEAQIDDAARRAAILSAAGDALSAALAMRRAEGERTGSELAGRLRAVAELVVALEERSGGVVETAKERLRKRAESLRDETGLLDEARLHQEIVLAADRMDIREELVRLHSHIDAFHEALASDEPTGRRLEFLLQEMGREANTVGSKASDAPLAHLVVDLKTELERIREQVQNVE